MVFITYINVSITLCVQCLSQSNQSSMYKEWKRSVNFSSLQSKLDVNFFVVWVGNVQYLYHNLPFVILLYNTETLSNGCTFLIDLKLKFCFEKTGSETNNHCCQKASLFHTSCCTFWIVFSAQWTNLHILPNIVDLGYMR